MRATIGLLLLLGACGGDKNPPAAPVTDAAAEAKADGTDDAAAEAPPEDKAEDADAGADATDAGPTPQSLYAECRDRVERPEADGECETDEDCATAGCGKEVCTTVESAKQVMSTCEVKPCFAVLDTCGCVEGKCSWSLKDEVPPMKAAPSLPSSLPPSKPAEPTAEEATPPPGEEHKAPPQ